MTAARSRTGLISRPWLMIGGSLAAMAVLVLLLWRPHLRGRPQGDLVLYCAAGLHEPMAKICAAYEKECGVKVLIESDGSGPLLSKLRIAPDKADLYLAGEESFIRKAQEQELVAEDFPVARQRVVLAVKPGNPLGIAEVGDLLRENVKVALPNPELTASGRIARRALAPTGEWKALEGQRKRFAAKVSTVGKVTEAAQAVKLGAADATFVWDATARQFGIEIVEAPLLQGQPPEQATLGVVAGSRNRTAALRFARYLTARDRGQKTLEAYHFQPIADAKVWEDAPSP
jgi:molybdate transport system substrate-binding protein